jgi:Lipocalin-like domain
MNTKTKFKAHWSLLSMSAIAQGDDENIKGGIYPIGRNVRGLLSYSENGMMSAQLGSAMRPNFSDNDFRKGSDIEIREAFNGYISYFGTYQIVEKSGIIIHDVQMSMFPNWIGTKVKRYFEFSDGEQILTLKATPIDYDGKIRTPTLVWRRI